MPPVGHRRADKEVVVVVVKVEAQEREATRTWRPSLLLRNKKFQRNLAELKFEKYLLSFY